MSQESNAIPSSNPSGTTTATTITPHHPSETITIIVKGQDGEQLRFRIRRNSHIKKVLTTYCERRFLEYNTIRFLIDGNFFQHHKSPDELGLEDGAEIDAMTSQLGGGNNLPLSLLEDDN